MLAFVRTKKSKPSSQKPILFKNNLITDKDINRVI